MFGKSTALTMMSALADYSLGDLVLGKSKSMKNKDKIKATRKTKNKIARKSKQKNRK